MKPVTENESRHLGQNEMAGLIGKSGPPGNMNAFKHGLAAIQKRRKERISTEHEESVRQQILQGLIADKGGDQQVSTATRILVSNRRLDFPPRVPDIFGDGWKTDILIHNVESY